MARMEVVWGDITRLEVDAIVNAANSGLLGGGGVDGAIHRAAGPSLAEECAKIIAERKPGGLPAGDAVITGAGNLPCRKVIHTVGPVWYGGRKGEPELLASCYLKSLSLGAENGCAVVAFPNISTGAYGYPRAPAAEIAIRTVADALENLPSVRKVIFVCFDQENRDLYTGLLRTLPGK